MAEVRNEQTGMVIPSLGRSVVYHHADGRKLTAIVTGPARESGGYHKGEISVTVFPPNGPIFTDEPVSHGDTPGCWSWPVRV